MIQGKAAGSTWPTWQMALEIFNPLLPHRESDDARSAPAGDLERTVGVVDDGVTGELPALPEEVHSRLDGEGPLPPFELPPRREIPANDASGTRPAQDPGTGSADSGEAWSDAGPVAPGTKKQLETFDAGRRAGRADKATADLPVEHRHSESGVLALGISLLATGAGLIYVLSGGSLTLTSAAPLARLPGGGVRPGDVL